MDDSVETDRLLRCAAEYLTGHPKRLFQAEVALALCGGSAAPADLPSERSMRDILNRLGYRLRRIRKGTPLKKTPETDAIFANVQTMREEAKTDPTVLEVSVDTKAKVAEGRYARGGKTADGGGGVGS